MKKIITLICAITLILSGCQASPDAEIVKQKADVKMQIEKNSTSESKPFLAPQKWVEKYEEEQGKLTIDINAVITMPKGYPIAVSAEPMMFSQSFADLYLDYFIGDKIIYKKDDRRTKKEIEEQIIEQELALEESKKNTKHDQYNEESYRIFINKLKEDWKTAPVSLKKEEVERRFVQQDPPSYMIADILREPGQTDEEYEEELERNEEYKRNIREQYNKNITAINGYVDLGDKSQIGINLTNNKMNNNTIACYSDLGIYNGISETRKSLGEVKPRGVKITLDEAEHIANDFLNIMGIEDMRLRFAQVGVLNEDGVMEGLNECYMLNYTKSYNDYYETYEITCGMRSDGFQHFRSYERMVICINDKGILEFCWTNPISFKEIIKENLELIEFTEIKNIFKQHIKNLYVWNNDVGIKNRTIVIDRITLGLMRVSQPNNSKEYLLIPVWDFFGREIYQYNENAMTEYVLDDNNQIIEEKPLKSFLTINAIDGTIIDRAKGY